MAAAAAAAKRSENFHQCACGHGHRLCRRRRANSADRPSLPPAAETEAEPEEGAVAAPPETQPLLLRDGGLATVQGDFFCAGFGLNMKN